MQKEFSDDESIANAFLGRRAADFANLLTAQAEVVYRARKMVFPVVTSSTLHYLWHNPNVSLASVSCALEQPHQVIGQRIASLTKLNLVQRSPDTKDRRRQLLKLTKEGIKQARLLEDYMVASQVAIHSLHDELGADLSCLLNEASAALKKRPFSDRFPASESTSLGEKQ